MTLSENLIENEANFRLFAFLGALLVLGVIERLIPNRALTQRTLYRWIQHFLLVVLNSAIIRFVIPVSVIYIASQASTHNLGIFNYFELPFFVSVLLSIIILDCLIYWQHRLFHVIDFLWQFHKVHHADLDVDVTTALRFHPIEMVLSLLIKMLAILILGAPVLAVIIFETILNILAMFNHSNIKLPKFLDKTLKVIIVTRNVHEIHHSTNLNDSQKNFGFHLIWWDKLFGSYKKEADQHNFVIGLDEFQNNNDTQPITSILTLPFKKRP